MTTMNDFVVTDVAVVMIGLSSLLRAHKGRKVNIVAVAVELMIYPSSLIDPRVIGRSR